MLSRYLKKAAAPVELSTAERLRVKLHKIYASLGLSRKDDPEHNLLGVFRLATDTHQNGAILSTKLHGMHITQAGGTGSTLYREAIYELIMAVDGSSRPMLNSVSDRDILDVSGGDKIDETKEYKAEAEELLSIAYIGGIAGNLAIYLRANKIKESKSSHKAIIDTISNGEAPSGTPYSYNTYYRSVRGRTLYAATQLALRGDSALDRDKDKETLYNLGMANISLEEESAKVKPDHLEYNLKFKEFKNLEGDLASKLASDPSYDQSGDLAKIESAKEAYQEHEQGYKSYKSLVKTIQENKDSIDKIKNSTYGGAHYEDLEDLAIEYISKGESLGFEHALSQTPVDKNEEESKELKKSILDDLAKKITEGASFMGTYLDTAESLGRFLARASDKSLKFDDAAATSAIRIYLGTLQEQGDIFKDAELSEVESAYKKSLASNKELSKLLLSAQEAAKEDPDNTKLAEAVEKLAVEHKADALSTRYLFSTLVRDSESNITSGGGVYGGVDIESITKGLTALSHKISNELRGELFNEPSMLGAVNILVALAKGRGPSVKANLVGHQLLRTFSSQSTAPMGVDTKSLLGEDLKKYLAGLNETSPEVFSAVQVAATRKANSLISVTEDKSTPGAIESVTARHSSVDGLLGECANSLLSDQVANSIRKGLNKLVHSGTFADMTSEEVRNLSKIYGIICDNTELAGQKDEYLTQSESSWKEVGGYAEHMEAVMRGSFKRVGQLSKRMSAAFSKPISPLGAEMALPLNEAISMALAGSGYPTEDKLRSVISPSIKNTVESFIKAGKRVTIEADNIGVADEARRGPSIEFAFAGVTLRSGFRKALEGSAAKEVKSGDKALFAKKSDEILLSSFDGTIDGIVRTLSHIVGALNVGSLSISSYRAIYEDSGTLMDSSADRVRSQLRSIHMSGYALSGRGVIKAASSQSAYPRVEVLANRYSAMIAEAVANDPDLAAINRDMEDRAAQPSILLNSAISLYRNLRCKTKSGPFVNSKLTASLLERDSSKLEDETERVLKGLESLIAYLASGCDPILVPETLGANFTAPNILALLGKQAIKATVHKYYMRLKGVHEKFFTDNLEEIAEAVLSVVMPVPKDQNKSNP